MVLNSSEYLIFSVSDTNGISFLEVSMKKMATVRVKIIASILICSIFSAVLIGIFSVNSATTMAIENATDIMESSSAVETQKMNVLIDKVEQSVNLLSGIAQQGVDFEKFKSNGAYVDYYTDQIKENILNVAQNTDAVVSAYIRYNPDFTYGKSGCFFSRTSLNEEFQEIEPTNIWDYEPTDLEHVGWYYLPIQNGEAMWMEPYYNANVDMYMSSYIVPMIVDGEPMGVVGFDIDITSLTSAVAEIRCYEHGYAFLLNKENDVMYHPQIEAGTNLNSDEAFSEIAAIFQSDDNVGETISYHYGGERKLLVYSIIDNGMKLVVSANEREIFANATQLICVICGSVLGVIVFACVFGIVVGTNIARPIKKLTQIIRQTADFDFRNCGEENALLKRRDEIGTMAQAIGDMRVQLRDIVNTMSDIQQNITGNVSKLDRVMAETNQIAEDNSATTQQLAAGMQQTEDNTNKIISHVDEVKEQSNQIFELSRSGKTSTEEVMERAKNLGSSTVASSEKTMRIFSEMHEKTEVAIEESKAVSQIQELTEKIKKISSQTNLLALNANIEAARAGEAGRGFAVVATQIGGLANQTFQTVEDINNIVEVVTSAVSNMTGCIEMLMEFIEKTVIVDYENFKDVGVQYQQDVAMVQSVIGGIDEAMGMLNDKINEISDVISAIGETVTEATSGISNIAEKSTESVGKTVEGYQQLEESKESVEDLKHVMQKFVL